MNHLVPFDRADYFGLDNVVHLCAELWILFLEFDHVSDKTFVSVFSAAWVERVEENVVRVQPRFELRQF